MVQGKVISYFAKNKSREYLPHLLLLEFHHTFGFHYEQLEDYVGWKLKSAIKGKEIVAFTEDIVAKVEKHKKQFKEFEFDLADKKYVRITRAKKRKKGGDDMEGETDAQTGVSEVSEDEEDAVNITQDLSLIHI